jgi:hypothetical protein
VSACNGPADSAGVVSHKSATLNPSFIGNSFAGQNFDHVPHAAQDLAVSGDGVAITGADWIESSYDVRAYTRAGNPVGPCPFSSYGRFRETGGGPLAVEATNTHVYAAQALRLVRWDRSTFMGTTGCDGGSPRGDTLDVRMSGGGRLLGLTVCGDEAYVVDPGGPVGDVSPGTAQIKVVNADLKGGVKRRWTVPHARHLTCDRQGRIWALLERSSTTSARLARYSPAGSLLTAFDMSGQPMDVAAHPNTDEVWVPDNGRDQRIEKYSYAGTQVGVLGESYLSGATPGVVGAGRLVGPRGVDIDAQGNAYVAESGTPNLNFTRAGLGKFLILTKYEASGEQRYRREGLVKASTGEPSADGERFYNDVTAYDKRRDGRWKLRAYTLDPFAHPNDQRYSDDLGFADTTNAQVRDFHGRRYVFIQGATAGHLAIYRLDGELLTQVAYIRGGGAWIEDVNGTRLPRPKSFDNRCVTRDFFAQANGDVWMLCQDWGGVWRFRISRFSPSGAPIYAWSAVDVYPTPGQLAGANAGRIDVHGTTIYVSGHAPGERSANPDPWLWMGRRIVKFPSLPTGAGWPKPVWNKRVFYNANTSSREKPVAFAVDGDRIAVGYQGCPYPSGGTHGCLRIYSATSGQQEGGTILAPPSMGEVGWLDLYRPLSFKNGSVYVEDGNLSKLWTVPVAPGKTRMAR